MLKNSRSKWNVIFQTKSGHLRSKMMAELAESTNVHRLVSCIKNLQVSRD